MFYDKFVQLCEQRGVKPTRAATEAGVARSAVSNWKSNWERGIEVLPTNINAKALASYFDVSMDALLSNEKKPAAKNDELSDETIDDLLRKAKVGNDSFIIMGYGGDGQKVIKLSPEKYKALETLLENLKDD